MNYRIELKVKDLLEQNHITQKRLAEIANMRESTISDIVRGTRTVINFEHLSRIAEALDIQDISQLIDFVAPQGAEGYSWEKGYPFLHRGPREARVLPAGALWIYR